MMPLARHRAINAVIADEVKQLHAVTIEAKSPDQIAKWVIYCNKFAHLISSLCFFELVYNVFAQQFIILFFYLK